MARRRRASEPESAGPERLQKLLAAAGIASRRACENLIRQGRVAVNGSVVRELGTRADARRDRIEVDGRLVQRKGPRRHYLMNKPPGVVTTTSDPHASRTVLDLLPSRERLFPVGRLDLQSEGLLLLTNDGELAQALLHPSFEVPRTYRVNVEGVVSDATLRRIRRGVMLRGRRTAECKAILVDSSEDASVVELTLIEGRRRQIREVMQLLGHRVKRLLRTDFGPLRLGRLETGEWRAVNAREQAALNLLRERALQQAAADRLSD